MLSKSEKEKKVKYLQACLERRLNFTPMVYSADVIPGAETLASHSRFASLLIFKMKRECYVMREFFSGEGCRWQ